MKKEPYHDGQDNYQGGGGVNGWPFSEYRKRQNNNGCAEVNGKVIGNSEMNRLGGHQSHVGLLGIIVARERNRGIGTKMLETLIKESRKAGLKLLILDALSSNTRARHVYEKVGFREAGHT